MNQQLRLCAPNTGGLGSIPGQGTRSHMSQLRARMPQLKDPSATTKTQHSKIHKYFIKRVDICICITDSLCSTPETNTTL